MKPAEIFKELNSNQKIHFFFDLIKEKIALNLDRNDVNLELYRICNRGETIGYSIDFTDDRFIVLEKNDNKIFCRKGSSDIEVFSQIFIQKEYEVIVDLLSINRITPIRIIDAGSNIGLTTLFLKEAFPNAEVIAIEPDESNFYSLSKNTSQLSKIYLENVALWNENTMLEFDRGFRDGKEWSVRVKKNTKEAKHSITAVTLDFLLNKYKWDYIDFLKIDIEGGEVAIFSEDSNLNFLDFVKVIAIEIHNEFNIRDRIYSVLINKGFFIFNSGELTIGIQK